MWIMYNSRENIKYRAIEDATYLLRDLGDALKTFTKFNDWLHYGKVINALRIAADNVAEELDTIMQGGENKDVS
jgi:hypothetical protein